jgi:hypothetical protein
LIDPSRFTPTTAHPDGAFLDSYHGGWQEIFPGGGPVNYRGAALGLHGEVAQLGWDYDILEDTPQCIVVKMQVNCVRTPFRLEKTIRLEKGSLVIHIEETVTNLSPEPQDFMWGHHPAFGAPFLHEGVRVFLPARRGEAHAPQFSASSIIDPGVTFNWPRAGAKGSEVDLSVIPGPEAGFAELVYLKDLSSGWFAVLDAEKKLGIGLSWPVAVFPYLWFWMVYGEAPGYPWWNRVYCIALEPWTSIPNNLNQAIEAGTQSHLKGGGQVTVSLNAVIISGKDTVSQIDLDGTVHL